MPGYLFGVLGRKAWVALGAVGGCDGDGASRRETRRLGAVLAPCRVFFIIYIKNVFFCVYLEGLFDAHQYMTLLGYMQNTSKCINIHLGGYLP